MDNSFIREIIKNPDYDDETKIKMIEEEYQKIADFYEKKISIYEKRMINYNKTNMETLEFLNGMKKNAKETQNILEQNSNDFSILHRKL